MSLRTGGNKGSPDAPSDTTCRWPFCTTYVPYRLLRDHVHLCQEHALYTWSVIQEQLGAGELTTEPEPQTPDPLPQPIGLVYYIRTAGRIKIGHTTNLDRRLAQYPPDIELLYVQPGTKTLERAEHSRFRAYLTEGREWFQDRPEVTEPIADLAAKDPRWAELYDDNYWRRRRARNTVSAKRPT